MVQSGSALRREVSKERREQLAQAFAALDADNSGSINMAELEVAAKALGFGPKKRARLVAGAMAGDQDQSGSLSLEEFVRLIAEGAGDAGGLGADAFPFGLMAETYRISRLVESYNPATHSGLGLNRKCKGWVLQKFEDGESVGIFVYDWLSRKHGEHDEDNICRCHQSVPCRYA